MALQTITKSATEPTQTPYKVDIDQVNKLQHTLSHSLTTSQALRASQALVGHLQSELKRIRKSTTKRNLLDDSKGDSDDDEDDAGGEDEGTTIWLTLTTKQHIVDKSKLLPRRIIVPHSMNASENLNICLITADPQRPVKNIVSDPSFPPALASKITRVIGYTKLKARYKTFESRRQLLNEHDVFLADDRIITRLVETLGKAFYKGTVKRPIPIRIAHQNRENGRLVKQAKGKVTKEDKSASYAPIAVVAKEIQSAIDAVPVSLKPGTTVAVRVANSSFKPQQVADNVVVVTNAVIEKHVTKGWRNVKAIHIKGSNTAAMPIWLADDLWIDDEKVLQQQNHTEENDTKAIEAASAKRKRTVDAAKGPQAGMRKKSKVMDPAKGEKQNEAKAVEMKIMQARNDKMEREKQKAFEVGV